MAVAFAACDSSTPPPVAVLPLASLAAPSVMPVPTPTSTPNPTSSPIASITPPGSSAEPPAPSTPPDIARLDGVRTTPERAAREPLALMLDDSVAARPQAGFNAASLVYQAPADGGEDRYMLVFQETDARTVGPIRSGRPYFVRWAAEFRAAFGHYGGDAKTLQQVIPAMDRNLIYDVDALRNAASAFHRTRTRSAPHNAYTSTAVFRRTARRVGAPGTMVAGLPMWTFADDLPLAERAAHGSITVPYGRGVVGYAYDRASNRYLRSVSGKPHIDAGDSRRVTARNVVVLFMRLSYDPESEPGHRRPILDQIGIGKAIVFRNGQAIKATWRKDDASGLTRFLDATGHDITLVRGRIFIQVVATGTKVRYTTR